MNIEDHRFTMRLVGNSSPDRKDHSPQRLSELQLFPDQIDKTECDRHAAELGMRF